MYIGEIKDKLTRIFSIWHQVADPFRSSSTWRRTCSCTYNIRWHLLCESRMQKSVNYVEVQPPECLSVVSSFYRKNVSPWKLVLAVQDRGESATGRSLCRSSATVKFWRASHLKIPNCGEGASLLIVQPNHHSVSRTMRKTQVVKSQYLSRCDKKEIYVHA